MQYVNTSNVIAEAIDKGYAIKEQIKNENNQVIKETYYDANYQPVKLYNSYYGLSYKYKEHQNLMHYLDADRNIMALSTGCATVIRKLDENGRNVLEEYYDLNMQPVKCYGYYGIAREYDSAGYCTSMTWLFIPFGIGMYCIDQKKSIFASAFLFSILIETTQYITGLGVAEFNDVFENTLGGIIGIFIASIMMKQIKK